VLIGRDVVLWSEDPAAASRKKQLLVLLHGATSDEHDLFDRLTPLVSADVVVASPRGPVPDGDGYSWASQQDRTEATSDGEVAALGNSIAQSVLGWLDAVPTSSGGEDASTKSFRPTTSTAPPTGCGGAACSPSASTTSAMTSA